MRRPAQTRAQRQHARESRALLALRRASVRFTLAFDADAASTPTLDAQIDLEGAANRYTNTLTPRERRRLAK